VLENNNSLFFNIFFTSDESTFIFNPTLKITKNLTSDEKDIPQIGAINNKEKFEIFAKCLEENNEKEKLINLCSDSVKLFKTNSDYEFIIYLFLKLCELDNNFRDIIKKLLDEFWEKNEK